MVDQVLDSMELERERGITIKSQAVRMAYKAKNGDEYLLNLIDTPGHVDFSYEVSRSLAACEGALLVVDAAQGVEAQTIANAYLAIDSNLKIIPVINKIDLPSARQNDVKNEIKDVIGIDAENAILVSAKTGEGVDKILEKIVDEVPPPAGSTDVSLQALVFDSVYDSYRGVIAFVKVVNGELFQGQKIIMMATGVSAEVEEVGILAPDKQKLNKLQVGEVGYVISGIKEISNIKAGDTITDEKRKANSPLAGYREVKPMVFAGFYPIDGGDYGNLRDAIQKLSINDPSLHWEPESSKALGFGFRCGFLGLLHMDIVKERLEREYKQSLLITTPSVRYKIEKKDGEIIEINNPAQMPNVSDINKIFEPQIEANMIVPTEYIGSVMDICKERRGKFIKIDYIHQERAQIIYKIPLSEVLLDFFGLLKARTRGYASFDYELAAFEESDLVRLNILIGGDIVDALSMIVPKESAYQEGREIVERLRKIIPRQMFEVAIQAAIGSKIIARESVKAKRKDVLAKCYGGDITRKRKLLEKQKAGKKKMKRFGKIDVPQEAFMSVLSIEKK